MFCVKELVLQIGGYCSLSQRRNEFLTRIKKGEKKLASSDLLEGITTIINMNEFKKTKYIFIKVANSIIIIL